MLQDQTQTGKMRTFFDLNPRPVLGEGALDRATRVRLRVKLPAALRYLDMRAVSFVFTYGTS